LSPAGELSSASSSLQAKAGWRNCIPRFAFRCPVALALLLAGGCASPSHRAGTPAPDWEDVGSANASLAPPPAAAPTPILPPGNTLPASTPSTNGLPPTPSDDAAEKWIPLQRWSRVNGLASLTRLATAPAPTYALRGSNGVFILRSGSQVADWNGLELRLGFPPQMIDGQPYMHGLDLKKTVYPLLISGGGSGLWHGSNPVIVIDPGHGGENAGTRSVLSNHYEKEYTLDWALRLRNFLAANGWEVWLTRTNDTDLAISNRVAFAEDHKASLFLSLHFNSAAPNQAEAGLETYCLTPAGMPSSLTRQFADDATLCFPNNAFDAENLQLALRVHRALLQVNGNHDRGVRHARFPGVLRGQNRPAILIEGGYLSNPSEARLIADPAYRQKLAEAVARALLSSGEKGPGTQDRGLKNETRGQDASAQPSPKAGAEKPRPGAQNPEPAGENHDPETNGPAEENGSSQSEIRANPKCRIANQVRGATFCVCPFTLRVSPTPPPSA